MALWNVTRCPLNSRESGWAMCMQYVWHGVNLGSTFHCIKGSIAENCNVGTLLHQCYLNHIYKPLIEKCWRSRGRGRWFGQNMCTYLIWMDVSCTFDDIIYQYSSWVYVILIKPFNVNLSYTEGIKSFATFLFVLFSRLLLVTMMNRQHGKYIFLSDVILSWAVHTLDFITIVFAYTDQVYPLLQSEGIIPIFILGPVVLSTINSVYIDCLNNLVESKLLLGDHVYCISINISHPHLSHSTIWMPGQAQNRFGQLWGSPLQ